MRVRIANPWPDVGFDPGSVLLDCSCLKLVQPIWWFELAQKYLQNLVQQHAEINKIDTSEIVRDQIG